MSQESRNRFVVEIIALIVVFGLVIALCTAGLSNGEDTSSSFTTLPTTTTSVVESEPEPEPTPEPEVTATPVAPCASYIDHADDEGIVFRLYSAYLDRCPDREGWSFWLDKLDEGSEDPWSLDRVNKFFYEFSSLSDNYGGLDSGEFVQAVYYDVLQREAEQGGLDYWTAQLDSGEISQADMILLVSDSAEYRELTLTS